MHLHTKRLKLTAGTAEIGHSEIENRVRFAELLDADVPSHWPPPLNDEHSMKWFTDYVESHSDAVGWVAWYFLLKRSTGKLVAVGNGGFKGKPDMDGVVEVGYSVMEEYQQKGIATEAVKALVRWAFSDNSVNRIIAHTFPDLHRSVRVLEKCGFVLIGKGAEAGTIKFELPRKEFERTV